MKKQTFNEFVSNLPCDICDSCFYVGSPNCPRGIEWRMSDERNRNPMLHLDDCEKYVYWREKYRALGTLEARVKEYGKNIWAKGEALEITNRILNADDNDNS